MPNLVSLSQFSARILDKTQTRVFLIFRFLVKSFMKKTCHNFRTSRTSMDTDMNLMLHLNLRRETQWRQTFLMTTPHVIFRIYHQNREIRKQDSGCMAYNSQFFFNATFYPTKAEKELTNL